MKTIVSTCKDVQISMDNYTVEWTSKIFDDNSTIGEIKDWVITHGNLKIDKTKFRFSGLRISDLQD